MSSGRKILSRIKSAKNISQITKAMQMVSASKMKKAQEKALQGADYSVELRKILISFLKGIKSNDHTFLTENKDASKDLCIFVTTNKGLCGGLNTNHFRKINKWYKNRGEVDFITVGKKGRSFAISMDAEVIADFSEIPDNLEFEDTLPISKIVLDLFSKSKYKKVFLSHNQFVSTLIQKPEMVQILPIEKKELESSLGLLEELTEAEKLKFQPKEYIFEPSKSQIIDWLLPYYIELHIFHSLIENKASEHSARMVAMKGASESAQDVMQQLRMVYNRVRQQQVTSEIADIVTATLSFS